jgi:hypothetical protein
VPDASLVVMHALPGRLRLRLPPGARTDGLAEATAVRSGVTSCSWSPRTRGLLVHYDPTATDETAIVDGVAEYAGIDLVEEVPKGEAARAITNGHSPVGAALARAFGEMNQSLARTTHGTLDLGMAVPLALAAWAVTELVRGRTAPLAWSSALWYAHGLFRDYNTPSSQE